jgi:transcriptional regulator with XRE-family HTH domain
MRSLRKTTVAVVREELGLGLKEFADLIGKSAATVSSLENGRLALSEPTALEISKKTGVGLTWLLASDPKREPVNIEGAPWSKRDYEKRALNTYKDVGEFTDAMANAFARFHAIIIEAILAKQIRKDPERAAIVISRVERFLKDLRAEFGADEKAIKRLLKEQTKEKNRVEFVNAVSSLYSPAKTSSAGPSPSSERPEGGSKSA